MHRKNAYILTPISRSFHEWRRFWSSHACMNYKRLEIEIENILSKKMIIGTCSSINHYTDLGNSWQPQYVLQNRPTKHLAELPDTSHLLFSCLFLYFYMLNTICLVLRVSSLSLLTSHIIVHYHNTICRYVDRRIKRTLD